MPKWICLQLSNNFLTLLSLSQLTTHYCAIVGRLLNADHHLPVFLSHEVVTNTFAIGFKHYDLNLWIVKNVNWLKAFSWTYILG